MRKLNPEARSSIVLFVGPPGVGKTSLGRSIAAAMERAFERISVGGVRDESEIRGHRRTYIGAMPGTIVRALRDAGSNNPVLMIDEIDKMGADFRGDPASAMLEVLDPEQNSSFRDHYLDVPFDLSNVFFICTANQVDTIPPALLDRMEMIELSGYTHEEKREIARRYLVPRQMERNGLGRSRDSSSRRPRSTGSSRATPARRACARSSARSARSAARWRASSRSAAPVEAHDPPRDRGAAARQAALPAGGEAPHQRAGRGDRPRVDAGRRRRAVRRGDRLPGRRQASDHRSARRRDEGVGRRRAVVRPQPRRRLGGDVSPEWFEEHDLHLHVPAGAIPKDGPSAGVTMATAIASRVTCRPVRSDTAMTGEITLTGMVLPIGGSEGEGARGAARRDQPADHPAPQRARHRRHPRAAPQEDDVPARGHGRRGA